MYTLLDLAKLNGQDRYEEIINEAVKLSPELATFPARTIDKTSFTVSVRTANPTVAFRAANQGVAASEAAFEERLFQTFPLDHRVVMDKVLRDNAGADYFTQLQEEHMTAALEAAFNLASAQTYYGNPASTKGFPGLLQQYADDTKHNVDAGGSTAKFSVWLLDLRQVGYVFGGGRPSGIELGEWKLETVTDSGGNAFQAFTNWLYGNMGFELRSKNAAYRIKNLSATDTGKGLTDALLNKAWTLALTNGVRPNAIMASPDAVEILRASRTATNPDGNPAPRPTDWNGVPIYETTGITAGATGE